MSDSARVGEAERAAALEAPRSGAPAGGGLLAVVAGVSALYALVSMCGGITSFTTAAFGPILLGLGGERPPAPPLELRWHHALEAIFTFALAVMLLCAALGTLRRQRRAALMLGLWSVSAIFTHAIFLAWWFTIADEHDAYLELLAAAQQHALENRGPTPRPFGEYEGVFRAAQEISTALRAIPFAYPALVGVSLLVPDSRRRIASWT